MNSLPPLASRLMVWVILIGVLLVLTAAISAVVFYVMYRRTAAGRWKFEVCAQLSKALVLQRELRHELKVARREEATESGACREHALQDYIRTISVSELEHYPGIGPATIERLRAARYRRVADLRGASLDIPGLGRKRIAEINHAVHCVIQDAQSRFDSGACREANDLAVQLKELRRRRKKRETQVCAQLRGLDRFHIALQPLVSAARTRISFWSYLREQFVNSPTLDMWSWLETPLPELQQFLRESESGSLAQVEPNETTPV